MNTFDYFYGGEAEQYSFYRIPRALIVGERFKGVSTDAKLLYGLMLDRMGLSFKNGWLDNRGRVYIYYSLEDIQTSMNCAHQKACKLLAELDTSKGVGLIERVKRGQGKPATIYVKRFYTVEDRPAPLQAAICPGPCTDIPDFPKTEVQTAENQKSGLPIFRSADFSKSAPNYTYDNQTYPSQLDLSIYPAQPQLDGLDGMDGYDCREKVKRQIGHERLAAEYGEEEVDELIELMSDIFSTTRPALIVGGEVRPTPQVIQRLEMLDYDHVKYILDSLSENTTKVRNIRAYLLAALYNAPATMRRYYQAETRSDLCGP